MEHTEHTERGKLENFSVKITDQQRAKLERLAEAEGRLVTVGEMVRRLIDRAVEPGGGKKKGRSAGSETAQASA